MPVKVRVLTDLCCPAVVVVADDAVGFFAFPDRSAAAYAGAAVLEMVQVVGTGEDPAPVMLTDGTWVSKAGDVSPVHLLVDPSEDATGLVVAPRQSREGLRLAMTSCELMAFAEELGGMNPLGMA
jgi:hypothetical protein